MTKAKMKHVGWVIVTGSGTRLWYAAGDTRRGAWWRFLTEMESVGCAKGIETPNRARRLGYRAMKLYAGVQP